VTDEREMLAALPDVLDGDDILVDCRAVTFASDGAIDQLVYEVLVSRRAATLTFLSATPEVDLHARKAAERHGVLGQLRPDT
jgi:hypothetical protein